MAADTDTHTDARTATVGGYPLRQRTPHPTDEPNVRHVVGNDLAWAHPRESRKEARVRVLFDPDPNDQVTDCNGTVRHATAAIEGTLPAAAARELGEHVAGCSGCATYLDQVAATSALLGARTPNTRRRSLPPAQSSLRASPERPTRETGPSEVEYVNDQRVLTRIARLVDPDHADDLVQDTWDHVLTRGAETALTREDLVAHLLRHVGSHLSADADANERWADALQRHHPHNPSDVTGTDFPSDPGAGQDLRTLADLDALDPDADQAELLLPDLYGDGPHDTTWASPSAVWPSITRILGPDAEVETAELYSVVDAALDELPDRAGDAMYLVDIEGHSLQSAASLLDRSPESVTDLLAQARRQVRDRVHAYLTSPRSTERGNRPAVTEK